MATSLYKAQFDLKICENHDKKELHAYCKTCDKKVCTTCIKEEHSSHDWETITDILREKKHSLPEECKEIRAEKLPGLKKELNRFERKIQEEDTRFDKNKSILNGSRQRYIDGINKLFDDKIHVCQQKSEAAKQRHKDKHEGLKQKVEYLDMATTALDKDINTLPDHDILDMEKEMRDGLEKALSYSADKYTSTTVFVPGQMDVKALENMIGEIHSMSVVEMNEIDRYSDVIWSVKPVSETNTWVCFSDDNHPKLLDRSGEELKVMKTHGRDLITSRSEDIVLSEGEKGIISILTQDEKTITTFDTKPLYPTFISKTENDDILVTLVDGDHYNLVPTSRRIVQRMTLTGKVLHTYEFREDGKTRLFTCPIKTAENKNKDVCVINWLSSESGELVVLLKDGRVKFTYRGVGLEPKKFLPYDVECDVKCRILLTELHSRAIHILSSEGMYLCKLCQYEQLLPTGISIYGDNLWCGFLDGKVKVYKYTCIHS
ncbi:hypothetical protein FSP39_021258 [Pinctada imbricata]|uniref:B box-type domain-containing protein n=1 Tax=Pinctada imbricata TaxID=66713 RepID=A0AA89BK91_PINIB|nr:hypothetical protein FSP39_021258 [Pinctada imbricata]